jgi:hypothetical protein
LNRGAKISSLAEENSFPVRNAGFGLRIPKDRLQPAAKSYLAPIKV